MFAFASLVIIILVIAYPKQSLSASLKGLDTWLNIVLPALLPFFIVSEIMIELGVVDLLSTLLNPIMRPIFNCPGHSSFVWIMSITSGYPTGPKLIASLYKEGSITKDEGQRMLAFCNNSGPLFMIGAVGIGILNNPEAGKVIAVSHLLGSLILGILFRFYGKGNLEKGRAYTPNRSGESVFKHHAKADIQDNKPFGRILGESVQNCMEAQLIIGGFIILFSVIINLLIQNGLTRGPGYHLGGWDSIYPGFLQLVKPIIAGTLEITTGCQLLGETFLPFNSKLIAASLIIGWGGFSIHSQAISFLANSDFSTGIYLLSKLLHGFFSAIITYTILAFYRIETVATFSSPVYLFNTTVRSSFIASIYMLGSAVFILIATFLLVVIIRSIGSKGR
ncbi:MAG TPA: sporulation integral membrane protein YlbJ [Clostridia bacterium]|nr:sporulation integral membrane protein YlbJ [Clostridia bacterium]